MSSICALSIRKHCSLDSLLKGVTNYPTTADVNRQRFRVGLDAKKRTCVGVVGPDRFAGGQAVMA